MASISRTQFLSLQDNTVGTRKNPANSHYKKIPTNSNKRKQTHTKSNYGYTGKMVEASSINDDLARQFKSQTSIEQSELIIEIIGLEMLQEGYPDVLDGVRFSDDDSSSDDSDNYANDSLQLAREMSARRANRISSHDSFANDSVEIAKKNQSISRDAPKDKLPVEIITLTPRALKDGVNIKNTISPGVVTPNIATMMPKRISNSAA